MNDELKEILAYFEEYVKITDMHDSEPMLNWKDLKIVLDYITDLQQEIKEANESVELWANRLKKKKKENEYLKKNQRFHKRFGEDSIFCLEYDKETLKDLVFELQQRINKAIVYIEKEYEDNDIIIDYTDNPITPQDLYADLLDILKGDSNE